MSSMSLTGRVAWICVAAVSIELALASSAAANPSATVWPPGSGVPGSSCGSFRKPVSGQQDIFWRGGGTQLWEAGHCHNRQPLEAGSPTEIPGVYNVASSPSAVIRPEPRSSSSSGGDEFVWYEDYDGNLDWVSSPDGGQTWLGPVDVGSPDDEGLGSAPSVAVWSVAVGDQMDVFFKGRGNGSLWYLGVYERFDQVKGVTNVASAPTAVTNTARDEQNVYWMGTDQRLWTTQRSGPPTNPRPWQSAHPVTLPHHKTIGPLGSGPSLAIWPTGTRSPAGNQNVFWKGYHNNGLYEADWWGTWHGPARIPGVNNVASAPSAVVNATLNEVDIFWKGIDGHLYWIYWNGKWGPVKEFTTSGGIT